VCVCVAVSVCGFCFI